MKKNSEEKFIKVCSKKDCFEKYRARGLCVKHYNYAYHQGLFDDLIKKKKDMKKDSEEKFVRICDKKNCFERHLARGLCQKHYNYAFKHNLLGDLIKPEDIEAIEAGNEELRKINSGLTAQLYKALTNQKKELKAEQENLRKAIAKFEVA
jgi:hypothetical protein